MPVAMGGGGGRALWLARARRPAPGCYRVGDQAAVIASLAGDGIAVALASGVAAAHACLAGQGAAGLSARFRAARGAADRGSPRRCATWRRGRRRRRLMMGLAGVPGLAKAAARLTRIG